MRERLREFRFERHTEPRPLSHEPRFRNDVRGVAETHARLARFHLFARLERAPPIRRRVIELVGGRRLKLVARVGAEHGLPVGLVIHRRAFRGLRGLRRARPALLRRFDGGRRFLFRLDRNQLDVAGRRRREARGGHVPLNRGGLHDVRVNLHPTGERLLHLGLGHEAFRHHRLIPRDRGVALRTGTSIVRNEGELPLIFPRVDVFEAADNLDAGERLRFFRGQVFVGPVRGRAREVPGKRLRGHRLVAEFGVGGSMRRARASGSCDAVAKKSAARRRAVCARTTTPVFLGTSPPSSAAVRRVSPSGGFPPPAALVYSVRGANIRWASSEPEGCEGWTGPALTFCALVAKSR